MDDKDGNGLQGKNVGPCNFFTLIAKKQKPDYGFSPTSRLNSLDISLSVLQDL